MQALRPALALLTALVLGSPALARPQGLTFYVNSTKDLPDATPLGDRVVDADLSKPGHQITLRAAIQEANALSGSDAVELPAGIFNLTIKGAGEDLSAKGDLDVLEHLQLRGAGAGMTIIDAHKIKDRVLDVHEVTCIVSDLTIRRGRTVSSSPRGGGIQLHGGALTLSSVTISGNSSKDDGGGLAVLAGILTADQALFAENTSEDDGAGLDLSSSTGPCFLDRTTFSKNHAAEDGGAIENGVSILTITNSTFSKNHALRGGAIAVAGGSQTYLTNCTLGRNTAVKGSGIREEVTDGMPDVIELANTIIANKQQNNYKGDGLTSLGHNLDSGSTCGLSAGGDQSNVSPKLKTLKLNGGVTPTLALKPSSPAIDGGDDGLAPSTDQRGKPRVDLPAVGTSTTDIGAYERQVP